MLNAETTETTTYRGSSESKRQKGLIKILVPANPKRPKTRGYKQFSLLMRYNGKHFADFKAEEGRHPTLDGRPGWPANELRWCVDHDFIKIS